MKKAMHAKPFRLRAPGHKARHARPESPRTRVVRAVSLCLACICLLVTATVYPASAATGSSSMSSLQNKLNKLSQSIKLHEQELNNAKKKEAAAKALESELKERVSVIQDQISVLSGQIASVQNSIGQKEQEISAKETEIAEKETEIEEKELEIQDQWSDFKKHMAAMQELRDGGSVAMLSAVNDLYELLTFNEVMQDISVKDTEIMDNMKTAKAGLEADKTALESDRAELVSQKADLQSQKKELDSQNSQMQSKQSELNSSISAAQMSAADAKKAQAAAQAAIESDELNYEAVKKQIQKLIAAAASSQPQLGFTGFDDFKQNFVRELEYLDQQQGKVDFNFPFAENDSPMRVAQNIGELYEEAVKDTMQLLRYEDLHKAVLLLKYHEEIHIFSAGTAINQAESFREKMLKIGKRVVIFNNLNYQRYQACCLSERDLAMIISYSGETAQMLEIARQCKRSGTPILALTSFGENSLTCYADCKLTLSTKESIYQNLGDYASHLSMTLLLDILYSEYFRQNYQKNYTYKLERARELEQHRTSTNPILLNLHKENAE